MRLRATVSYKIQYSELIGAVSNLLPSEKHHITMAPLLLYLWTMAMVEVQGFRTPLPYGTGWVQSKPYDDEWSSQGIFHLICKAVKYAIDSLLQAETEGNDSYISKILT